MTTSRKRGARQAESPRRAAAALACSAAPISRAVAPAVAAVLLAVGPSPAPAAAIRPSAQEAAEPAPIEAGVPAARGEYDHAADILHYHIELSLGGPEAADGRRVEGRAVVVASPNGAASVPLDFTGLAVRSVSVAGGAVPFGHADGKLVVPVPPGADTVRIEVEYFGVPDDGLVIRDNVHGRPTAFADNWPNRARFWFPSVDHPSDKATASFVVHAPEAWQVIANGALAEDPSPAPPDALGGSAGKRTWRWETSVPHPTYTLVVGAAEFAVESLGRAACGPGQAPASREPDGCVDVSFWVYPEDAEFAREVFARAPAMVDFFVAAVGPYPFEKLANVQSATRFGGMENSSAIFYSEAAVARGTLSEGTVSHEIAHQWFGDSATESTWADLWLSEGFATYFGALFFEHADGVEEFRRRMESSRQRYIGSDAVHHAIVGPEPPASLFQLLNANNYSKGGWTLHMLRGLLGDDAFFRGIRAYYAAHAYGLAETADLRRALESASGRALDWFFDQWVYRPGFPELESEWTPAPDGSKITLTVKQIQRAEWPVFRLPMEVEIRGPGGPARRRIDVTERSQSFTLSVDGPPSEVVIDPDGWVLKGGADRDDRARRGAG